MSISVSSHTVEEQHHIDNIARFYVKCVLWLGVSDPGYVSAYFGPERLREEVLTVRVSPESIAGYAGELLSTLDTLNPISEDAKIRRTGLIGLTRALKARAGMLAGGRLIFDEAFGIPAPEDDRDWFFEAHAALDAVLPGSGDLAGRYQEFMASFIVPRDRLFEVFVAAVEESRCRTSAHTTLPPEEGIEYIVKDGYSRYLGGGQSLIRVDTDLPITIDRILPLACRETYPGRHTIQTIRETVLVQDRGWIEHTVVPVASPFATITEGAARLGVDMAFPGADRVKFAKEVLFPLAGLEVDDAMLLDSVSAIAGDLFYAGCARVSAGLAAGTLTRGEGSGILEDVLLLTPDAAKVCFRSIERFEAYLAAVNEGYRCVRNYVEAAGDPLHRWDLFTRILTEPLVPADLAGVHPASA